MYLRFIFIKKELIEIKRDKRKLGLLLVGVFLIQSLFLTNIFGLQDDSQLEVTIHAKLESNSSEVQSTLMDTGSYSFFETPNLDIGTFEHDLTTIDITDIQQPSYNETESQENSLVIGVNATVNSNHTINFNKTLEQYELSNLFETQIKINVNYSSEDPKKIEIFNDNFTTDAWDLYGVSETFYKLGTEKNNYLLDNSSFVSDWAYAGTSYDISGQETYPTGIAFYDGYWWLVGRDDDTGRVYKYNSDWSYAGESHGILSIWASYLYTL